MTAPKNETFWDGKNVLITGGSAGLGRALALEAAARGARVVVVARGRERLRELEGHAGLSLIAGDVADPNDVTRITSETMALLGGIDVLVNNASYLGETPLRLMVDSSPIEIEAAFRTNVLGPIRLTQSILPDMLLRGRGLVVNISSDAAVNAYPQWGGYSASKAALDHLSRIWNEEVKDRGVRVLAIDPGDMDTAMHRAALPETDPATLSSPDRVAHDLLDFLPGAGSSSPAVRFAAKEWRA